MLRTYFQEFAIFITSCFNVVHRWMFEVSINSNLKGFASSTTALGFHVGSLLYSVSTCSISFVSVVRSKPRVNFRVIETSYIRSLLISCTCLIAKCIANFA